MMGIADYLDLGNWNAQCDACGKKFKASMLRKDWRGLYLCPADYETRHPQDFARGIPDIQAPPWTRPPPEHSFVLFCTPNGSTAIAGFAVAGCAIAGYTAPGFDRNGS